MRICYCLEALSDAFKCFSKLLKGFQNITCLKFSDKVRVLNDIQKGSLLKGNCQKTLFLGLALLSFPIFL